MALDELFGAKDVRNLRQLLVHVVIVHVGNEPLAHLLDVLHGLIKVVLLLILSEVVRRKSAEH